MPAAVQPRAKPRASRKSVPVPAPLGDAQAARDVLTAAAPLPLPSPLAVLAFAEKMSAAVCRKRREQLAAGLIDQARHDADVAAAAELLRLAQDVLIFEGRPLN